MIGPVWKFPLRFDTSRREQVVKFTSPKRVYDWLHVGVDESGDLCVWAIMDDVKPGPHTVLNEDGLFAYAACVIGTGGRPPSHGSHRGSALVFGWYMAHVFI